MDELLPISLEDFQKYIDDNNIKSKRDFRLLNRYLYNRYIRLIPKENRLLKFKEEYYHHFDYLSTVEDFQRFINDNNIKRPVEFRKRFPKEYDRMLRALSKEDKAKLIYEVRINSYSNISTINNLQEFIEINEVHSRKELHKLYPGLPVFM